MHTEHTKLGADGRIVIPAALRAELNFQPGDPLVLESDGDSLLVRSFEAVIRETQEAFAPHRSAVSIVDELIAERRAEAARELAEEQRDAEPRRG